MSIPSLPYPSSILSCIVGNMYKWACTQIHTYILMYIYTFQKIKYMSWDSWIWNMSAQGNTYTQRIVNMNNIQEWIVHHIIECFFFFLFLFFHASLYMGLLRPAWCTLFSVTLLHFPCSTCFGCNIHPSSGASYNAHAAGTCKCTCELTRSTPDTAWNGSTHTCTYLYHLHVHYMTLLRMDVYYIQNM